MARKSIESRMDRIMDVLLPPGSMAHREYHLSPEHRDALDHHRRTTASILSRYENREPGGWYAAYLADDPDAQTPPLSDALREALHLPEPPVLPVGMSHREIEQAFRSYALGESDD